MYQRDRKERRDNYDVGILHNIKEINEFREEIGMKLLKEEQKKCLVCDKSFSSRSGSNRICNQCKGTDAYKFGQY